MCEKDIMCIRETGYYSMCKGYIMCQKKKVYGLSQEKDIKSEEKGIIVCHMKMVYSVS